MTTSFAHCTSLARSTGDDDSSGGGGGLGLSDVMMGGGDDTTFQQLARNPELLDGLDFPLDTLSQLPSTPPRLSRSGPTTTGLLSPPSNVGLSTTALGLYDTHKCGHQHTLCICLYLSLVFTLGK